MARTIYCRLQVGVAARAADNDNEGGELAQLMEALGDDERAGGGIRFGRDDKVCQTFLRPQSHLQDLAPACMLCAWGTNQVEVMPRHTGRIFVKVLRTAVLSCSCLSCCRQMSQSVTVRLPAGVASVKVT